MAKETYIRFRCTDKFKELVEKAATQENRTTSNYTENLLKEDMIKKGILKEDYDGNN